MVDYRCMLDVNDDYSPEKDISGAVWDFQSTRILNVHTRVQDVGQAELTLDYQTSVFDLSDLAYLRLVQVRAVGAGGAYVFTGHIVYARVRNYRLVEVRLRDAITFYSHYVGLPVYQQMMANEIIFDLLYKAGRFSPYSNRIPSRIVRQRPGLSGHAPYYWGQVGTSSVGDGTVVGDVGPLIRMNDSRVEIGQVESALLGLHRVRAGNLMSMIRKVMAAEVGWLFAQAIGAVVFLPRDEILLPWDRLKSTGTITDTSIEHSLVMVSRPNTRVAASSSEWIFEEGHHIQTLWGHVAPPGETTFDIGLFSGRYPLVLQSNVRLFFEPVEGLSVTYEVMGLSLRLRFVNEGREPAVISFLSVTADVYRTDSVLLTQAYAHETSDEYDGGDSVHYYMPSVRSDEIQGMVDYYADAYAQRHGRVSSLKFYDSKGLQYDLCDVVRVQIPSGHDDLYWVSGVICQYNAGFGGTTVELMLFPAYEDDFGYVGYGGRNGQHDDVGLAVVGI